jgi:hypothetical protein
MPKQQFSTIALMAIFALTATGCAEISSQPVSSPASHAGHAPNSTPSAQIEHIKEPILDVLLTSDSQHVVVPVSEYGSPTVTASESSRKVTLTLILAAKFPAPLDYPFTSVMKALPSPLDGRTLIDGSTGRAIGIINEQSLGQVTYLPSGYKFSEYMYSSADGWQRVYRRSDDTVEISQLPSKPGQSLGKGTRVIVRGSPAVLSGNPTSWTVTWLTNDEQFKANERDTTGAALPSSEVLHIASGLRP